MSVEFEIESWVYSLNFFLHNTWNFFWVQTSATRFINIKTKTSLLYSTTLSFKYLFFKKYFIEQNQRLSKCFCTFSLLPIAFKLFFPWHITNNLSDFFLNKSKWCKLLTLSNAFNNTVVLPNSVELIAFTNVAIKSLQNV